MKGRRRQISEVKDSLVYKSFRTVEAIQRKPREVEVRKFT